jgi:hypothetical protein
MKSSIILIIIMFVITRSPGQNWTNINFDDGVGLSRVIIDTSYLNNVWQIGQPQKSLFNISYSIPNSIITDTVDPYPINNTSVFYLGTGGDWFIDSHTLSLNFLYRIDSDSLNDFGRIEFSLDTGQTWNNILFSENGGGFWRVENSLGKIVIQPSLGDTIVFTGSTDGWYRFMAEIHLLEQQYYDTIIYRFTFNSDGIIENKDGWIIDDLGYKMVWEGINDGNDSEIIYPNPVTNCINIRSHKPIRKVEIINLFGIPVKILTTPFNYLPVEVSDLIPGIYYCSIVFESGYRRIEKIIKY